MALLKFTRFHFLYKSAKPNNPCNPLLLLSSTHGHFPPSSKHICSKTHNFGLHYSIPPDHTIIRDGLISIFTSRDFSPESQELEDFGSKLTTEIVEDVLKGFKNWKLAQMFFSWASNQYGYRHNCYTFNVMASILSRVGQNVPLRILATDLVNSRCWMTAGALGFFVRCLGSQGLVDEANWLFDQVKKMGLCIPNSYSYNCLLEAISKSNSVDLIEDRVKEMCDVGLQLDKYALTPLLKCYCNAGKFEKALDVFNRMYAKDWVDGHVLAILVLAFSKWGEVDKAFELIERMEELKINLNEKTFCVLIHGFVRESRVDKALQLLNKMHKLGFAPDISVYDVLIGGLCKNKDMEEALHLYTEMKRMGICPDVKILTVIMSCLSGEKEMMQLLEKGQEDLDSEAMVVLYKSALRGLVNCGSTDKAYHLLWARMGDSSDGDVEVERLLMVKQFVHPDTTSFEIVIDGLCQTDKLDEALGLFLEMDRIGCKRSVLLYNNLIDCLSNSNRLEECFELLSEMKKSGFEPTQFTHNSIFGCLCRREDTAGALDIIRLMRAHGHEPWIKYSTLLVKKLCNHGKAVEARGFLADIVQEGFLPDIIAYSAVVDGFLKVKEVDQALELFREICARGYGPDVVAYNIVINGLCKAKRVSEAQDILNEMLEKGLVPSVVTYNSLIDGLCKNGDIDQAILCYSRMVGKEQEPNVITYTTLVDAFCNAGRPNDALSLWNNMRRRVCSPNRIAFMALIHGLCKCGRPHDALLHLQEMEEKQVTPDPFIYVGLIDAFIFISDPTLAFDVLKKMVHNGNFPNASDKNHLLLKEAILRLSEDARTSSTVKYLMEQGSIPRHLSNSDVEMKVSLRPSLNHEV
ncbi:unnamed protein product [Ilex paraguariensis]|uniref:Pentatricopeptide repeat-containing protein n=1 Tax=Ilex paraguariensis TaxID=185542 RepID=A0ABC8SGN2_9AQUA